MAVQTGRGFAAIEYPTGMNQNGDPSQAWIKVKPDGRVDVFAGTSDIGNGSKTIQSQIVAETIGVPYEWITYDNSNTDSSPVCTGTFASRATFVAGKAVEKAAESVAREDPRDRGQGARDRPGRPRDRRRRGDREGRAAEEDRRPRRGRRGDVGPRRADHRHRRAAEAVRDDRRAGDGQGRPPAPLGHLVRLVRGRGRGRRRDGRRHGDAPVAVLRRRPLDQPDARRGPDRGRRHAGPRARRARELLPVLPLGRAPRRRSSARTSRRAWRICRRSTRSSSRTRPTDGPYGAKGIGEMANNAQPPAIAAAVFDAVGVWVTELPITPERVLRALQAKAAGAGEPTRDGKTVIYDERAVRQHGRQRDHLRSRRLSDGSPFRTFNGVEPFPIFDGVGLHPIAGDQVFLGRVTYAPGTTVKRHSHEHTEQAMLILEGSLRMTIGEETRELGPGDACVVNRAVEHELYSERRRHVHRGARARPARPHRRPRARPRARRPERLAPRRAVDRRGDVRARARRLARRVVLGAADARARAAGPPRRGRRPPDRRPGGGLAALRRAHRRRARRRRRRRRRRPLARRRLDPDRRDAAARPPPRLPLRAAPRAGEERDRPLHDRGGLRAGLRREHRHARGRLLRLARPAAATRCFFHDCTEEDAAWAVARLRPQSAAPRSEPWPLDAIPPSSAPRSSAATSARSARTGRGGCRASCSASRRSSSTAATRRSSRGRASSRRCCSASRDSGERLQPLLLGCIRTTKPGTEAEALTASTTDVGSAHSRKGDPQCR